MCSYRNRAFELRGMKIATREGCRVGQKMSITLVFSNWTLLALEETFLSMSQRSRVIIFRFNSKTQWQMSLILYDRHVCVHDTNMATLHAKLYKFGWHTSAKNSRMKNRRDLILGEVVYISIIYRIPDSWLYSQNGYDFSFDHITGENREYASAPVLSRLFLPFISTDREL